MFTIYYPRAMHQGNNEVVSKADQLAEIAHLRTELLLDKSPHPQAFAGPTEQCLQGSLQQR